jgi:hypothetical protein
MPMMKSTRIPRGPFELLYAFSVLFCETAIRFPRILT